MISVLLVYDPKGRPLRMEPDIGMSSASLTLDAKLDNIDIYKLAQRLAEMLLENLDRTP